MARILYGVAGEGLGHASRAKAVLEAMRHDVVILSSERAFKYLAKYFPKVRRIFGFHIIYRNNAVHTTLTVLYNLLRVPLLLCSFLRTLFIALTFRPNTIITDYDPFTCYVGLLLRIPVISISNQHILNHTSVRYLPNRTWDTFKTHAINSLFIPSAKEYLITTFSFGHRTVMNAHLIPPILRKELQNVKAREGKHILVYQTSRSNHELLKLMPQLPYKFIVYGFGERKGTHNVRFKGITRDVEFFNDLATCKAVITNGGFSLMSEAVMLGKPVLAEPVKKQFEQVLNGLMLQWEGFGLSVDKMSKKSLQRFLNALPRHKRRLQSLKRVKRAAGVNEVLRSVERVIRQAS